MVRELKYILAVLIGVGMMVSCVDEPIIQGSGDIPEGYAKVSAKVSFKPFGSALNGGSRTAGDAIKEIESLYVLFYDENQNLIEELGFDATNEDGYDYVAEEERNDGQSGNDGHLAEQKTPCAKFQKTIPYGKYYIFAVANFDLTDKDYSTIEKLRSLPLTWNNDVAKNNEMFGYFTTSKVNGKPNGWQSADPIAITSPTVDLYAWIRRAASKVTVAYDARGLNENIFIYLKSVTIKDIPKECYLGKDNAPSSTREGISNDLLEQGETIYYKGALPEHTVDDYTQWPRIARGAPYYYYMEESGNPENLDNAHTEGMNALFFYENYQNDYESIPDKQDYDKRQDGNGDGELDEPGLEGDETYKLKDNVAYGTYIEVEGYYENRSNVNVSRGRIVYRFMLGKNETYNYQAERNYHYKLTLRFQGNANDVDWHIEYTETPGIYVPNPWYVSYLYEQTTYIPLKISGNPVPLKDSNGNELDAVLHGSIIKSDWYPYTITEQTQASYYTGKVYTSWSSEYPLGDGTDKENGPDGQPWNGFLSLKSTDEYTGPDNSWGFKTTDEKSNNFYYWNQNGIGVSFYSKNPTLNDYHRVTKTGDSYFFEIPVWTRQKNLITATGFTGNNIYVGNLRMAKVLFKARINDYENLQSEYVNVIQVRRMVNPKGIYRKYNSTEPFQVTLMYQQSQYTDNFVPLVSEGEWEAVIEKGAEWIELNDNLGSPVYGATGSIVSFKYAPKDALQDENDVRCGIIRVRYHNKSCSHLIFVRQGYAPIQMTANGPRWYTFNMYDKDNLTNSPLEEGSLFRHGNWTDAILASNNTRPYFGFGENIADGDNQYFLLANNTSKTWSDISFDDTFEENDGNYRIPTLDEWNALKNLEIGTGVLYGDGAKGTASTIAEAYGYNRTDGGGSTMGMRGYFIYDKTSGNNIFFPIGYEGYGRRKREFSSTSTYGYEAPGTLRYAQRTGLYETTGEIEYRPMFWDIYKSNGAVYWSTGGNAWDMNYHTLDFSSFNKNAYTDGDSDACFIRCVVK